MKNFIKKNDFIRKNRSISDDIFLQKFFSKCVRIRIYFLELLRNYEKD